MWTQEQFEEVQHQFPHPVRLPPTPTATNYCVGGALIESQGGEKCPFPNTRKLQEFLLNQTNSHPSRALEFATLIIHHSDRGNFETAWRLAHQFLVSRKKETR